MVMAVSCSKVMFFSFLFCVRLVCIYFHHGTEDVNTTVFAE